MPIEVDGYKDALPRLPDGDSMPSGVATAGLSIDKNDSACHSYQTCRSLVSRHIETCNSELLGRYKGSCARRESMTNTNDTAISRTLKGKKRGNQLNMSFDTCSLRWG